MGQAAESKATEEPGSKMETFIIKMLCNYTATMFNPLKKFQKNVNDKFHWHNQSLWHHQKIIGVQSHPWSSISSFNVYPLVSFLSILQFFHDPKSSQILSLVAVYKSQSG